MYDSDGGIFVWRMQMNSRRELLLWMMMTLVVLWAVGFRNASAQQSAPVGKSAVRLPPDVHPETFSRMPQASKGEFTSEEDKQAYDQLIAVEPRFAKPSNGPMGGTGTRLHMPVVANAYRIALNSMREKSGLDQKYLEIAILVACRESNNEYEWVAYEDAAAKHNSTEIVEIIRNKRDVKGVGENEETLIRFGREMSVGPKVSSKTFADMERLFGRRGTLDLALLMGYYENNAFLFRVYDQRTDPNKKRPFPDVLAMEAKQAKNQ
jgi:hypothetical protein